METLINWQLTIDNEQLIQDSKIQNVMSSAVETSAIRNKQIPPLSFDYAQDRLSEWRKTIFQFNMNIFKRIISFFKKKKQTDNLHNSTNNFKKQRKMSLRENFISDAPDEETGGKVNAISQNKTLYIGQFTETVAEPELFQDAQTMKDVFTKFKPKVDVEFQTEQGDYVEETIAFNEMKDFEINNGSGQLVQNSSFLLQTKSNIEANAKIRKQIEQNKRLRDLLAKQESKEELRNVLQNLLDELDGNKG